MHRVWIAILVMFVSMFRMVAMAEQPQAIQELRNFQSAHVLHGSETAPTVTKPSGPRQAVTLQRLADIQDSDATIPTLIEVAQRSLVAEGTTDFPRAMFWMNFPENPKKIPKPGISSRL